MSLPISHCEYHGVQLRRTAFYQCLLPSLVPRPLPRFYLAAMEKNPRLRDKIWAEAWERGYLLPTCMLHYSSCIWQVLCPCLSELKFLACLVFIICEFHKDITDTVAPILTPERHVHFLSFCMYVVLLQNSADPSIRNTDGKTPQDLAEPSAKLVLTGGYKREELLEAARWGRDASRAGQEHLQVVHVHILCMDSNSVANLCMRTHSPPPPPPPPPPHTHTHTLIELAVRNS